MATAPVLVEDESPVEPGPLAILEQIATAGGNIADLLDAQKLASIGQMVVEDYERDLGDRSEWEDQANEALKRAAQEPTNLDIEAPAYRFSSVNFPILTVASQQFWARAYPAICKSGSMVKVRVVGSDKGRPLLGPDGQQAVIIDGQPVAASQAAAMAQVASAQPGANGIPGIGHNGGPALEPAWITKPGAKAARASRVSDYMNVYLEYRMDDWERDTSTLLLQLPIIGCGFRKLWWAKGKQHAAFVSALDLVVPSSARSLKTTPRITERLPDVYPYQIRQRQASGEYRDVLLPDTSEDSEAPRLLLEQHRFFDLDGDGADEPYIITVDHETNEVLKIVANFSPDDIELNNDGTVASIERQHFYVKYSFLPDPKGRFYDIGFGHLLTGDGRLGDVIDTTINQMFDAGAAQIAGGGFIASGLRFQGAGQTNTLRWNPGEYKSVNATGDQLRNGIVERTFPGVSPVMLQLLELMLGAAKDITSVKDVVTGEASNQGQVGTTLALIEQGLAVFTAIYKLTYLTLGEEFQIDFENLGKFGGPEVAEDYANVLDDPMADFAKDFGEKDMDIKPVADPSSVTKMQRVAKAQALLSFRDRGHNDDEIDRRALEALDIEDIDSIIPAGPKQPNPMALAELENKQADTALKRAQAEKYGSETAKNGAEVGMKLGEADAHGQSAGIAGGVPPVEGQPGNAMGGASPLAPGGGSEGDMGGPLMVEPRGGPALAQGIGQPS
jgi:chaperonin GroES